MYMAAIDLSSINFQQIGSTLVDIIIACGAIVMGLYAFSGKFRNFINDKMKDTESIKNLENKSKKINERADKFESYCQQRSTEVKELCTKVEKMLEKLDAKVEKDKASTILTLKYEILDICSRAQRYKCITQIDKSLLCELYHEYVDIWKENHYVKSEADNVINNFPVVLEYKR